MHDGASLILAFGVAGVPAGWLAARLAAGYAEQGAAWPVPLHMTLMAAAWGWAAVVVGEPWLATASAGLAFALVCLAAIDLACFRLPDRLTLPLLAAGLLVSAFLPDRPWLDHLAGAAVGYLALAVLAWSYERWRGIEGLGLGDAKLLGAAGAWLGWRALPSVLLLASAIALAWVAVRWAGGARDLRRLRIAFGAPLALAIWIVWLYGPLAS